MLRVVIALPDLTRSINGTVLFDEPLSRHTTFKIGGPAQILVIPSTVADIQKSIKYAKQQGLSIHIIGNGSKVLVPDSGLSGLTIKINRDFDSVSISGNKFVAGASCQLSRLLFLATDHALKGLEFSAGIPATLGGAIVMNAGTTLGSMSDIVSKVEAIDLDSGSLMTFSNSACNFKYRDSVFRRTSLIITSAEILLTPGDKDTIQKTVNRLLQKRVDSQPLDKPNAGSIFKNPEGNSAGKLIDSANLKGLKVGQAEVSIKHSNFIVNLGGATAHDVLTLIKLIQSEIMKKCGVSLDLELVVISEE